MTAAIGQRRRGRAYALQVLYARDINASVEADAHLAGVANAFGEELDGVDRAVVDFAEQLARRVAEHAARIDDIIGKSSRNWRLERMSRVDRNILRLATCELLHFADTPTRVVLNEAVELAKQFGTAESPAFVNGVVDRIAQLVAAEVPARAAEPTA